MSEASKEEPKPTYPTPTITGNRLKQVAEDMFEDRSNKILCIS